MQPKTFPQFKFKNKKKGVFSVALCKERNRHQKLVLTKESTRKESLKGTNGLEVSSQICRI